MKKTLKQFGIIIFIALIASSMGSCFSLDPLTAKPTTVFDENIPEDQRAILIIPGGHYDVFEFSGSSVRWFKLTILEETRVHIPSGIHTMKFRWFPGGNARVIGSNEFTITADYKAGHVYELREKAQALLFGNRSTFHIYDLTTNQNVEL